MKHTLKLCVVTTHPIQYMAPWFRSLAQDARLTIEVIFFRELNAMQQGQGFGQSFQWDVPLRQGYPSKVLDVQPGWRRVLSLMLRLRKALRLNRPDALLITGWNEPGLVVAYALAVVMRIPILVRGESNDLRPRTRATRFIHRTLLRCASGVLVIGKANQNFYLNNGVPPHRIFEGVYFVESERMIGMAAEHAGEIAALRQRAGFTDQDFVFCFVGKHVAFKRPMLLVEAAAQVRESGWPVKLHFAGSGELAESLKLRAEALRVPTNFTGFLNQTEMWKAYLPADAFVLPSDNGETWGLVTNEAMLFGLPVIVSDQVGCGPDLVIAGETGFIFAGGAQGLAEAMTQMLQYRSESKQMGLKARERVLEHFSMQKATQGLLAALATVSE